VSLPKPLPIQRKVCFDSTTNHPFRPELLPDDDICPATSLLLSSPQVPTITSPSDLHVPRNLTRHDHEAFKATFPTPVQVQLDQPFGKDTSDLSFTSDVEFRHILLFLYRSCFLTRSDRRRLEKADPLALQLSRLLCKYSPLDFRPFQGYGLYADFETETEINQHLVDLASATLPHYNFDVATTVRYIGGPHIAAHRDVAQILATIQDSVEPAIQRQVHRLFTVGASTWFNGHSSAKNFREFHKHGNHTSAAKHPKELMDVFVKDAKHGFNLVFDLALLPFIWFLHLTPTGLVDLNNQWKSDRPVFDSSFHPYPSTFAIKDWCDIAREPPLESPQAFLHVLVWIWNLRISYPSLKILLGDNDIAGAFRLVKYHPNLVALHGYTCDRFLGMATGQTFGDSPSPANFEPLAIAHKQHASWLWEHQPNESLAHAKSLVDRVSFPPEISTDELLTISQANSDSLNPGVLRDDGSRLPPVFLHHVDDCMFADIISYMPLTSSCSTRALTDILGEPHPNQLPPLSEPKLDLVFTEEWIIVGHYPNSRRMVVGLSPRRRAKILSYLSVEGWLRSGHTANLRSIAQVHGILFNAAVYFPWAKCQFFILQILLRDELHARYTKLKWYERRTKREATIRRSLPREFAK
jgi:hypothetical protein